MTPQAYIAAKATVIREYRKRGDELSRKVARDLLKCDINKVGKIWDFLVRVGVIQPPSEAPVSAVTAPETSQMDILPNGDVDG